MQSADDSIDMNTTGLPSLVSFQCILRWLSCPTPEMGRPGMKPSHDANLMIQLSKADGFCKHNAPASTPEAGQALVGQEQQRESDGEVAQEGKGRSSIKHLTMAETLSWSSTRLPLMPFTAAIQWPAKLQQ